MTRNIIALQFALLCLAAVLFATGAEASDEDADVYFSPSFTHWTLREMHGSVQTAREQGDLFGFAIQRITPLSDSPLETRLDGEIQAGTVRREEAVSRKVVGLSESVIVGRLVSDFGYVFPLDEDKQTLITPFGGARLLVIGRKHDGAEGIPPVARTRWETVDARVGCRVRRFLGDSISPRRWEQNVASFSAGVSVPVLAHAEGAGPGSNSLFFEGELRFQGWLLEMSVDSMRLSGGPGKATSARNDTFGLRVGWVF